MMFDYSEKVVNHFLHPRHLGVILDSEIDPATERLLVADAGQVTRGDALRLSLKLRLTDELILNARFQNFGTGMPIASASCLCSMIVGKTISEALGISATDLDRELEGLPELKNRQPVLILIALDNAARKLRGLPLRDRMSPGEEALCTCFEVPESIIERAVRLRGLKTVDEITAATKAGGGCHTCHPELEEILARCEKRQYKFHIPAEAYDAAHRLYGTELPSSGELAHNPPEKQSRIAPDGFVYPDKSPVAALVANTTKPRQKVARRPWNEMTYAERVQRIQDVIEYDLRPAIRTDGGDVKLVDVKDNRVLVTLHGHCKTCHSALSTLKMGVEKRLQDAVWPELEVEEIFIED